ncbi:MAG: methyltransferase family protein [Candidatus Hodarchaeota archaeon]
MKQEYQTFLNKVPALRSLGKIVLTIIYIISLILISILYFFYLDPIIWFMPIATQSLMAVIVVIIAYIHLQNAEHYRKKYGDLAYQAFFYHYIIPLLVSWYALFFHPLFISGIRLFPFLISIIMAIIFFIFFILVTIHIERAGFKMITHGMDLYTVFPEETSIVRGEIYGFIRHPLYLSLTCGCFALAFIANNLIAFLAAIIQLIPCILVAKMEDKELIKRVGDAHRDYINSTQIIFPFKRILGFLKLLFFFK